MKRIVHRLSAGLWIISLILLFAGCEEKDEAGLPTDETIPAFSWDDYSFLLEKDNGWSITRFNNRVALSNFARKCQYLLSWEGNMGDGEKAQAVLKIAEVGQSFQEIALDRLTVTNVNGMYYTIHFVQEEKEGKLILSQ